MLKKLSIALFAIWPLAAFAQDSGADVSAQVTARDRSYLTGLIEDNLSSPERSVVLEGFQGALSSTATFQTLSIADGQGVWLTIRDGSLKWERSALLRGEIKVDALSAKEILLARLPEAEAKSDLAASAPFSLPELPVLIEIGSISADKIALGAPVFGQELVAKLTGSIGLGGGEGTAKLDLERIDGQHGKIALQGGFSNASRRLSLDLLFDEGPDGVAASALNMPGRPAVTLALAGEGPLDHFSADFTLATDGSQRLSGKIALSEDSEGTQGITAQLSGNIAPLLRTEYRPFFGQSTSLSFVGTRDENGLINLSDLSVETAALSLEGRAQVGSGGLPESADIRVFLGLGDGTPVILPLGGDETSLTRANLFFNYDRAQDDGWALTGTVNGLEASKLQINEAKVAGSGRIRHAKERPALGGTLHFSANGIESGDPALAEAIGPALSGRALFSWQADAPLRLSSVDLSAGGLHLRGNAQFDDIAAGIEGRGQLLAEHTDISRLAALSGRPLSGSVSANLNGAFNLMSGAFDGVAAVVAEALAIGVPEVDNLLTGRSTLNIVATRDEAGLHMHSLDVQADGLHASANGAVTEEGVIGDLRATLEELAQLGHGFHGKIAAQMQVSAKDGRQSATISAESRNLRADQRELDRLLGGTLSLAVRLHDQDGRIRLDDLALKTGQLNLAGKGVIDADSSYVDLNATLANTEILVPGFPGATIAKGRIVDTGSGYRVELSGKGPGGTQADVKGSIDRAFKSADMAIVGNAEAAVVNSFIAPRSLNGPIRYNLALRGKPSLASLSGRVSMAGGRFVAPKLGIVLKTLDVDAQLANARAQVSATGQLESGGAITLSGPIGLNKPFDSALNVTFNRARLRDPALYDTRVSGQITINGPLARNARVAGQLTLADTEVQIPSGGLGGVSQIPVIVHKSEPAAVRETRRQAGLLESAQKADKSGGAAYPLDVRIASERGIFVRGRGLDAELGGALFLRGTTADVRPDGEFRLVRGRLDILGKRFTLDKGRIALQGAMIPWIEFSATTQQSEFTTTIGIEGPADEPKITLSSVPELPEEEVLARLLFNRGVTTLSPLQAAQLASAISTLAGKGGTGILNNLRESTGLDDLDISTDETGAATVKAGKYLSDNLYTDVAIDSSGKSEINLNLDITPNLTARGSLGSDGNSGIGVFYEKDY